MNSGVKIVASGVVALTLTACAPLGLGGATYIGAWPTSDQEMTIAAKREVESLLRSLGYARLTVDGSITPATRDAIRRYQRDVGAPANGFISMTLLASLKSNAGAATTSTTTSTPAAATTTAPAAATPQATTPTRPTTTFPQRQEDGDGGGSGGGGGGGGSGGGAWG